MLHQQQITVLLNLHRVCLPYGCIHSLDKKESGLTSQQREKRREKGAKKITHEGTWRTSFFRDLLQGDGVPSPVVGQIGVGARVLLLHVDS